MLHGTLTLKLSTRLFSMSPPPFFLPPSHLNTPKPHPTINFNILILKIVNSFKLFARLYLSIDLYIYKSMYIRSCISIYLSGLQVNFDLSLLKDEHFGIKILFMFLQNLRRTSFLFIYLVICPLAIINMPPPLILNWLKWPKKHDNMFKII